MHRTPDDGREHTDADVNFWTEVRVPFPKRKRASGGCCMAGSHPGTPGGDPARDQGRCGGALGGHGGVRRGVRGVGAQTVGSGNDARRVRQGRLAVQPT